MKNKRPSHPPGTNRRRYGRVAVDDIECSVGRIINISAGGMVVVSRQAAHKVDVTIGAKPDRMVIKAERVWAKRYGFTRRLVAYRFIDPPSNLLQLVNGQQLQTNVMRVI